eukprot:1160817-Pelagomonas_calceolata.AAC.1
MPCALLCPFLYTAHSALIPAGIVAAVVMPHALLCPFLYSVHSPAAVPNAVEKKKLWEIAAPGMRTDAQGVAGWKGKAMQTSAGPVTAPSLADARIA